MNKGLFRRIACAVVAGYAFGQNREWNSAKAHHHDDCDRVPFAAPTEEDFVQVCTPARMQM